MNPATTAASAQAATGQAAGGGGDAPEVSAVVLSWNRQAMLRRCLRALQRQHRPPAEVVVVDNGSTDGTERMLAAEFPDVRLIRLSYDTGIDGFNVGALNAQHELIVLLDDDSELAEDWLREAVTLLQQESETTAIITSVVVEAGMPEEVIAQQRAPTQPYQSSFMGGAALVRRGVFVETGMYRREFFLFGNERDFAARLLNRGYRIRLCPTATVFHQRGYGVRLGPESLYYHIRNNIWYVAMYYPAGAIFRLLGKSALALVGVRASARGPRRAEVGLQQLLRELRHGRNAWIALCAVGAALRGLPRWLRHRAVCRHPDFTTIL